MYQTTDSHGRVCTVLTEQEYIEQQQQEQAYCSIDANTVAKKRREHMERILKQQHDETERKGMESLKDRFRESFAAEDRRKERY